MTMQTSASYGPASEKGPGTLSEEGIPFKASDFADDGKYHLLLAASGSVATIKLPNIIKGLASRRDLSIRVLLTDSAAKFLQGQSHEQPHLDTIANYPNVDAIYLDHDEWRQPWTRGAAILHIELRRWAHDLYVVPVSANTLAKLAYGMSDNLLTSLVRAWEVLPAQPEASDEKVPQQVALQKVVYLAPAMNTAMWLHPATKDHLSTVERYGRREGANPWMEVIPPQVKELACGDTGTGAMRDWEFILSHIVNNIENHEFYP